MSDLFALHGTAKRAVQQYTLTQLKHRADEYTKWSDYDIFVGTWNVNGKVPKRIKPWLNMSKAPHIYALGLQEMVDLSTLNVVSDAETASRCAAWEQRVPKSLRTLYSGKEYELIASKYMVGLCLLVFADKETVMPHVRSVMTSSIATGIGGVVGNKGGVGVSFLLRDTRICFVNSHLAAHRDNVKARNSDFHEIRNRMEFSNSVTDKKGNVLYSEKVSMMNHDAVFWCGDLNYRIDVEIEMDKVYTWINTDQLRELRRYDQLNMERSLGNVFKEFEEAPLIFPPTYKFRVGKLTYDRRPDKKMRCPAWCDRVLWKNSNVPLKNNKYECIQLSGSDHLPVRATFCAKIRMMDREMKAQTVKSLQAHCAAWAKSVPRLDVSPKAIAFGVIRSGTSTKRRFRIFNDAAVPVKWALVRDDEMPSCSSWLHVEPDSGLVPANSSIEIVVSVRLDLKSTREFIKATRTPSQVLVIRPYAGSDIFIPVAACYEPTCLDFSISELLHLTGPIRSGNTKKCGRRARKIVPTELWRLLDALNTKKDELVRSCLENRHILNILKNQAFKSTSCCSNSGVRSVFMSLDEGSNFDPSITAEDLLRALWHFLRRTWQVRIPIPAQRVGMKTRAEQNPSEFVTPMMQKLSLPHYHTLVLLVLFVRSFKKSSSKQCRDMLCRYLAVPIVLSSELYGGLSSSSSHVATEKTIRIFSDILGCLVSE